MEPPLRPGTTMPQQTRQDTAFTIPNWQNFLERQYHILSLNLNPMDFFSWLRTREVFKESDQELVLNTQHTTVARMGLLVDIVKRRGEAGFKAFMEVVEFTYPEIFSSITGQLPRTTPPEGYVAILNTKPPSDNRTNPRPRPQSIEILGLMGDLVQTLFSGLTYKKEELSILKGYCDEMQENICREKADLYLQMKCSNEMIHDLKKENDELNSKLDSFLKERQEMASELENLRGIKDKYMEESSKLGKLKDELSVKVQTLEDELVIYKSTPVRTCHSGPEERCPRPDHSSTEEISTLKRNLSAARKRLLVSSFERAQLEGSKRELKSKYEQLVDHLAQQAISLEEVMNERNMTIAQKQSIEAELNKERQLRTNESKEFHSYKDKYIYMESELKKLQDELEQLKTERATADVSANGPVIVMDNLPLIQTPADEIDVLSRNPVSKSSDSPKLMNIYPVGLRSPSPSPRPRNIPQFSPLDPPISISDLDCSSDPLILQNLTAPPLYPRSPVEGKPGNNQFEPAGVSSSVSKLSLEPNDNYIEGSTSPTSTIPTVPVPQSPAGVLKSPIRTPQLCEISRRGARKMKEPHYFGVTTST